MYCVDSIATKSGDIIYFYVDIVNNDLWYRIIQESQFSSSSYYDGNDLDRAVELYKEILLAFKGLQKAENFKIDIDYIKKLLIQPNTQQCLKMKPLFLGISDF